MFFLFFWIILFLKNFQLLKTTWDKNFRKLCIIRCVSAHALIIFSQTHWFVYISLITKRNPLIPFVSYGMNLPLSAHAFWLMARCLNVKLFPFYCLFGNTWFNLLSGAYYSLYCYICCLWLKGTSCNTILCIIFNTTLQRWSGVGLGEWLSSTSIHWLSTSFV